MGETRWVGLLSAAIVGCGSSVGPVDASSDVDLPSKVREAAQAGAVFSFRYLDAPPAGRNLQLLAMAGVDEPCGVFESGGNTTTNFVALNLVTSSNRVGTYAIEAHPDLSSGSESPKGFTELILAEQGAPITTLRAVSGEIQIKEAPLDEEGWSSDSTAFVQVFADFSVDPIAKAECSGGQATGSTGIASSCQCERLSGATFSCNASKGTTCCDEEIGQTVSVEFEVRAAACAAACAAAQPELLTFCRDLLNR